ncbi:redoxin domain-containing protein [candidate division KSB1 bacterium]|nr:redoxin domain-containing protein [candidate division KSB1 bacterium]
MKKLKFLGLGIMLLCAAALSVFAQNVSVGENAPAFELTKFGGGTVSMSDYPGKIILLNFLGSY